MIQAGMQPPSAPSAPISACLPYIVPRKAHLAFKALRLQASKAFLPAFQSCESAPLLLLEFESASRLHSALIAEHDWMETCTAWRKTTWKAVGFKLSRWGLTYPILISSCKISFIILFPIDTWIDVID